MKQDLLPAVVALPVSTMVELVASTSDIPGPTEAEWTGVIMTTIALVVRELLWWFRNRNRKEVGLQLPPTEG